MRKSHRPQGFALVLALALLVLLVAVIFALATFLGTEIQTSSTSLDREKARQNALAGLAVAVGQLQELAGPDARITAPAGLLPTDEFDPTNEHWVGVWDAKPTPPATDPVLLGWLVSPTMDNSTPPEAIPSDPADALASPDATPSPSPNPPGGVAWAVLPAEDIPASSDPANPPEPRGVRVPLVDVAEGKFGYWIADENTKANVVAGQPANSVFMDDVQDINVNAKTFTFTSAAANGDAFRTELWRSVIPHRLGTEALPEVGVSKLATVNDQRELASATSVEAAELALDTPLRNEYFHDITATSRSVLTDVPRGRLKMDFSDADKANSYTNTNIPKMLVNAKWRLNAWLETPSPTQFSTAESEDPKTDTVHEAYGASGNSDNPLDGYGSVVLTEFGIRFSVYRDSSSGNLAIKWQVDAELWNPWNTRFRHPLSNYLSMQIHGLPTITVTSSPAGLNRTIDLEEVVNTMIVDNSTRGGGASDRVPVFYMFNGINLPPGGVVVYRLAGSTDRFPKKTNSSDPPIKVMEQKLTTNSAVSGSVKLVFGSDSAIPPGAALTVNIPPVSNGPLTPGQLADRKLKAWPGKFQVTISQEYDIRSGKEGNEKPYLIDVPPFPYSGATVTNNDSANEAELFGYGFEVVDDLAKILKTQDPRSRPYKADMFEPVSSSVWSADPVANTSGIDTASGTYFRKILPGDPAFVLFESVRDVPLSIGSLQHSISDEAYHLGSPTLSVGNWMFDSGYFSGVYRNGWSNTRPGSDFIGKTFANPFITLYSDPMNPIPASHFQARGTQAGTTGLMTVEKATSRLMLEGGFNINSLSVPAWRVMLSGINLPIDPAAPTTTGWPHKGSSGIVRKSLERAFFRFPNTSTNRETFAPEATLQGLSNTQLKEQAFVPQIRSPSADQIKALAEGVVAATKSRGKPWASVQEFVNFGVLAHLLDPTGADGDPSLSGIPPVTGINQKFIDYKYSPIYLTQQDILTQIAPLANVRGDTFMIRAYGDRRSPATGRVLATAVCEVIVQRVPTPTNLSDVPNTAGHSAPLKEADDIRTLPSATYPLGRAFKIVSLRWL